MKKSKLWLFLNMFKPLLSNCTTAAIEETLVVLLAEQLSIIYLNNYYSSHVLLYRLLIYCR